MPGGVKLHRVFFCRLRNREAWLEGSDLLILKRDHIPPWSWFSRGVHTLCAVHLRSATTTKHAVMYS